MNTDPIEARRPHTEIRDTRQLRALIARLHRHLVWVEYMAELAERRKFQRKWKNQQAESEPHER